MTEHAKGPFDVKLAPVALAFDDSDDGAARGRMSLDKHYHGDLEAASKGEMLTAMTGMQGSASPLTTALSATRRRSWKWRSTRRER